MIIREMNKDECFRVLAKLRLARLGCARNDQPYVVPVYLAYHESPIGEPCLYGYSTVGQKVEWMRANPQVCVEFEDVTTCNRWTSVIVFGRYGEVPYVPEPTERHPSERAADHHHEIVFEEAESFLCYQLLQSRALWWEPASTARAAFAHSAVSFVPVFYKISIDRITGHEAMPDSYSANTTAVAEPSPGRLARLRTALKVLWRGHRTTLSM